MSEQPCTEHGFIACSRCVVITDAARRMSDEINGRIAFINWDVLVRTCMAFRLDDGTTDAVLYPDRKTALTYNHRACAVFYFRNCLGGTNPKDCQIFLNLNRAAYENDRVRWVDPESPDLILSNRGYDFMSGRRTK